jgi:multiple sugar transport system substrate-binding protein
MKKKSVWSLVSILAAVALLLAACSPAAAPAVTQIVVTSPPIQVTQIVAGTPQTIVITATPAPPTAVPANTSPVTIWFHSGTGDEHDAMTASIKAFQDANPNIKINFVNLPAGDYNAQVQAAAFSRKLPCLLDFDGPNVANYAWAGLIIPLDSYIPASLKSDLLPSIIAQGTFEDGKIYSLGQFDSGLGFWANKDMLTKAGVRIPTVDQPWDKAEFDDALAKLKASGVQFPLDLGLNYGAGEWFTYGFSPMLESFGGDLINRKDYQSADGVLNGPQAVAFFTEFKSWIDKGYVNAKQTSADDFVNGVAAISFIGHWAYGPYTKALGAKAVVIPMVDFGQGVKTGMGSWNWGITKDCANPDAAWKVLSFLMSPAEVKRITDANGAVPALKSVLDTDPLYAPGGLMNVYTQQLLKGWGVPRPNTPAYPTITQAFAKAVDDIRNGADIKTELDKAVKTIDDNIKQNGGYPLSQ